MERRSCLFCALLALGALVVLAGCGGNDSNSAGSGITVQISRTRAATAFADGTSATLFDFYVIAWDGKGNVLHDFQTRWDWNGDKVYDTQYLDSHHIDHLFDKPGRHVLRAQVKDPQGRKASASQVLIIAQEPYPVSITPTVDPIEGTTSTDFRFGAIVFEMEHEIRSQPVSRDQWVRIGEVRWDWEGDGIFDTPFIPFDNEDPPIQSYPVDITRRFDTPGTYHVMAQARLVGDRVGQGEVVVNVQ